MQHKQYLNFCQCVSRQHIILTDMHHMLARLLNSIGNVEIIASNDQNRPELCTEFDKELKYAQTYLEQISQMQSSILDIP
jgi:hypothetical protein